jgi:hypothetical protein
MNITYTVYPRYTHGVPRQVTAEQAQRIARLEREAFDRRTQEGHLRGIVIKCWEDSRFSYVEDLLTGRVLRRSLTNVLMQEVA